MTPMQIFDGSSTQQQAPGQGRLANLAQAVRQHEDTTRGQIASSVRPQDLRLYRRLREVCGDQSRQ
jgi:hypothetical protein